MHSKSLVLFLVVAALVANLSFATTITLTGYCPTYPLNRSVDYFEFNISNQGNGTAANMEMTPSLPFVAINSTHRSVATVGPGSGYSERFYLSNMPESGSYETNINVSYLQDGTAYKTVFPCIIYFGMVYGGPLEESAAINKSVMHVNIINTASNNIAVEVQTSAPQGFTVVNSTRNITVKGYSSTNVSFLIQSPLYNSASFPIVSELSYDLNGTHYSAVGRAYIVFGAPAQNGNLSSNSSQQGGLFSGGFLIWLPMIGVVIVIVLIATAVIFKKRAKPKQTNESVQSTTSEKKDGSNE